MCRCCLFIFSCFLSYQVLLLYQEVYCHATASFPKIISCTRCLKIWPIGRPMRTKSSASMLGIANRAASSAWVIPVRAASQAKVWPLSSSVSRRKRPAWNSPGRKETLSLEVFAALLFIFYCFFVGSGLVPRSNKKIRDFYFSFMFCRYRQTPRSKSKSKTHVQRRERLLRPSCCVNFGDFTKQEPKLYAFLYTIYITL